MTKKKKNSLSCQTLKRLTLKNIKMRLINLTAY